MLSRKQFFKEMLSQGLRALNILTSGDPNRFSEQKDPKPAFDLPLTELSPSLLSIEAQRRGLDLEPGGADEFRRAIYQEMSRSGPKEAANNNLKEL